MRRAFHRLVVPAVVLMMTAACGGGSEPASPGQPAAARGLKIAMIAKASTNPVFLSARTGAEAAAKELTAKHNVPAEMHIFENGPHGVGLALGDSALSAWPTLLTNWLRGRGLLTRPPA